MPGDDCIERPVFGGAISTVFPLRFQDISDIRPVPDHQVGWYMISVAQEFSWYSKYLTGVVVSEEVFADPSRDEILIFELLDLKRDVEDNGSALWFLRDLATVQDAQGSLVLEHSGMADVESLRYRDIPTVITTAVGQMSIAKGRQGREAQNIVRVYLANIRLKEVGTDVLITAYEPLLIIPLSESAGTVGYGPAVPARETGCLPVADAFQLALSNFKVHDWNLFAAGP